MDSMASMPGMTGMTMSDAATQTAMSSMSTTATATTSAMTGAMTTAAGGMTMDGCRISVCSTLQINSIPAIEFLGKARRVYLSD